MSPASTQQFSQGPAYVSGAATAWGSSENFQAHRNRLRHGGRLCPPTAALLVSAALVAVIQPGAESVPVKFNPRGVSRREKGLFGLRPKHVHRVAQNVMMKHITCPVGYYFLDELRLLKGVDAARPPGSELVDGDVVRVLSKGNPHFGQQGVVDGALTPDTCDVADFRECPIPVRFDLPARVANSERRPQVRQPLDPLLPMSGVRNLVATEGFKAVRKMEFSFEVYSQGREKLLLEKRKGESLQHVLQKGLLWALYVEHFPNLLVEPTEDVVDRIDPEQPGLDYSFSRYWPDLVALDTSGRVVFWGECGKTALEKIRALSQLLPGATVAVSKWDVHLPGFAAMVSKELEDVPAEYKMVLFSFPQKALNDYFRDDGTIVVTSDDSAIQVSEII